MDFSADTLILLLIMLMVYFQKLRLLTSKLLPNQDWLVLQIQGQILMFLFAKFHLVGSSRPFKFINVILHLLFYAL